ncbi:unnamed protein product [Phytophthora fragariaefolia]|uniref:Unnamed protein product n=1 Tax=Phytophthora fragariaefolia TaxID=1490495 RepID=A0A9W6X6I7_9STRA|nr:unnamed protein product [Phytophthora fragariaefolia]
MCSSFRIRVDIGSTQPELSETKRLDFDKELLPEDSWEPDENDDQFEVEAIVDDALPLSNSTSRAQRRFEVKWVGYDEPSWEPLSKLFCVRLSTDQETGKPPANGAGGG